MGSTNRKRRSRAGAGSGPPEAATALADDVPAWLSMAAMMVQTLFSVFAALGGTVFRFDAPLRIQTRLETLTAVGAAVAGSGAAVWVLFARTKPRLRQNRLMSAPVVFALALVAALLVQTWHASGPQAPRDQGLVAGDGTLPPDVVEGYRRPGRRLPRRPRAGHRGRHRGRGRLLHVRQAPCPPCVGPV